VSEYDREASKMGRPWRAGISCVMEKNTYSECVSVVLFFQHVMRMHRITLPSVVCQFLQNFSTSNKDTILKEKKSY